MKKEAGPAKGRIYPERPTGPKGGILPCCYGRRRAAQRLQSLCYFGRSRKGRYASASVWVNKSMVFVELRKTS